MERGRPQEIIDHYRDIGAIRDEDFPPSLGGWFEDLKRVTPLDHVAGIAPRSLLFVHGSEDETVPVSHAHDLYEKAGEPKEIIIIDGAGHRLRQDERVFAVVMDWLKSF
jgi:fermentation-respiration switch protein FrsA (DUF1100 family)